MGIPTAKVAPAILSWLGERGVRLVTDSLWPESCQTCGDAFNGADPELVVDDFESFTAATLHHTRCRPSDWYTGGVPDTSSAVPTFTVRNLAIQLSDGPCPTTVINPALERVWMTKGPDGSWRIVVDAPLSEAGMTPLVLGLDALLGNPALTAKLTVQGQTVKIQLAGKARETYEFDTVPKFINDIHAKGRLLVLATHALDPREVHSDAALQPVVAGDRTVGGWVRP